MNRRPSGRPCRPFREPNDLYFSLPDDFIFLDHKLRMKYILIVSPPKVTIHMDDFVDPNLDFHPHYLEGIINHIHSGNPQISKEKYHYDTLEYEETDGYLSRHKGAMCKIILQYKLYNYFKSEPNPLDKTIDILNLFRSEDGISKIEDENILEILTDHYNIFRE